MPPPKKISARQRVLAQWRGVDLSPLETARAVRARRVGDVLPRVTVGFAHGRPPRRGRNRQGLEFAD